MTGLEGGHILCSTHLNVVVVVEQRPVDRICAIHAARLYVILLQLPGSGGYKLYHPMLFQKAVNVAYLYPESGKYFTLMWTQCAQRVDVYHSKRLLYLYPESDKYLICTIPVPLPRE